MVFVEEEEHRSTGSLLLSDQFSLRRNSSMTLGVFVMGNTAPEDDVKEGI